MESLLLRCFHGVLVCEFVLLNLCCYVALLLGCCFVICPSREEADKAVGACHNKKTLPGVSDFDLLVFFRNLVDLLVLHQLTLAH